MLVNKIDDLRPFTVMASLLRIPLTVRLINGVSRRRFQRPWLWGSLLHFVRSDFSKVNTRHQFVRLYLIPHDRSHGILQHRHLVLCYFASLCGWRQIPASQLTILGTTLAEWVLYGVRLFQERSLMLFQMKSDRVPVYSLTLLLCGCRMRALCKLQSNGSTTVSGSTSVQVPEKIKLSTVPCLQPPAARESMPAALSLFICGYLAAEKYSLFPTRYLPRPRYCHRLKDERSTLTDISKSIKLYLHDEHSIFRILAVDLSSRGFHIWQHYIDAMEILRSLFTLATTSKKESITAQNVGAQARLAILHIAASNTPLFMTTLGLDILSPDSLEYRKSVLQIVAFLIRKVG